MSSYNVLLLVLIIIVKAKPVYPVNALRVYKNNLKSGKQLSKSDLKMLMEVLSTTAKGKLFQSLIVLLIK